MLLNALCVVIVCANFANAITENSTERLREWKDRQLTTVMDVYMFNWTNPEDIHNPEVKPNFEEVGPYRFNVVTEKINVHWNEENQTVTYQNLIKYYFDEENSPRQLSDIITTGNIPIMSAVRSARHWSYFLKQAVSMVVSMFDIYVKKTVSELLFEGYEDDFLVFFNNTPFTRHPNIDVRFGFLYGKNGSESAKDIYNIAIGPNDDFGTLKNLNYQNTTSANTDDCAKIKGYVDSELLPKHTNLEQIEIFTPDACRVLKLTFEKNVTVHNTFGYRYHSGAEMFDNDKSNECYCNEDCIPSGVIDVSNCTQFALHLSLPHFYNADAAYSDAIEGMKPLKDKHECHLTLDPVRGAIIDGTTRIQLNVPLKPDAGIKAFKDVPEIMIPVLWIENRRN